MIITMYDFYLSSYSYKNLLFFFYLSNLFDYFNSHHPNNVKEGIVCCLQRWAKAFSSNIDAYQEEEMINLRRNLHCKNYPERIKLAPRNLNRRTADNTGKLTTVSLPYVKGLAERIQKICCSWHQNNIQKWLNSLVVFLLRQTTNRMKHDQELYVLHPL